MSENEGPVPVTSAWLNAAYIPPDDVTTGPIPTITDDMTADDVARLSQVQALMSSSAPSATDPTVAEAEDPGVGQADAESALEKQAGPDDGTAETVAAAPVEVAASREPAEEETVTGGGADVGSGESVDDSEAVTTMFAVVTEEAAEDAETTSFAAVDPWMEPSIAQNRVVLPSKEGTGAGTPPLRRQRSRAVLIAMAGALVVVILGVMAAVAFGGQREQDPNPAPVPSVPASVPPTRSSAAGPDKAFPHYSGGRSLVLGRITDRTAGLSYSRLGGPWGYGQDGRALSAALGVNRKGPQLTGIMTAGTAEYLSAPLPASLGRSATATAAQAVARSVIRAGSSGEPTLLPYAVERLDGGLKGWLAGFEVRDGRAAGEIVAVAVVDTGAGRPGVLYVTVPKAEKAVRPDIRAIVKSLRVAR